MAVLEEVYGAQRGRARNEIVRLSPELCDELLVAAALMPMTVIDLRLSPSPDLVASDASSKSEAAVVCSVGSSSSTLCRRDCGIDSLARCRPT